MKISQKEDKWVEHKFVDIKANTEIGRSMKKFEKYIFVNNSQKSLTIFDSENADSLLEIDLKTSKIKDYFPLHQNKLAILTRKGVLYIIQYSIQEKKFSTILKENLELFEIRNELANAMVISNCEEVIAVSTQSGIYLSRLLFYKLENDCVFFMKKLDFFKRKIGVFKAIQFVGKRDDMLELCCMSFDKESILFNFSLKVSILEKVRMLERKTEVCFPQELKKVGEKMLVGSDQEGLVFELKLNKKIVFS